MKFTGHDPTSTLPNPQGCGCQVVMHPKPLEYHDGIEQPYGCPPRAVTIIRSQRPMFAVQPCTLHTQAVLEATGAVFPEGFTRAVGL